VKQRLSFILLSVVVASCAASLPYSIDYPLTQEVFHSRDHDFSGQVPLGWFSSSLDTLPTIIKVWLLKEDLSASFHIEELRLDQLSSKQVEKEGVKLLAKLSLAFQQDNAQNTRLLAEPKEFKIHGREFCGYELNSNGERNRIVVFSIHGKHYECVAASVKGRWSAQDFNRLFTAQQTLLSSLTF
jgi:hypothetical protein